MQHQKDFSSPQPASRDNSTPAGKDQNLEDHDNPDQALEEGDPQVQGRSRGQIIGQPTGQRDGSDQDLESGRPKSVPEM